MPDYFLRDIDAALWRRVKKRAREEGRSLRYILITLATFYAKWGLPKETEE